MLNNVSEDRLEHPDDRLEHHCDIRFLGRVALVRGVAGYSYQTFPWTICQSVRRSVGESVGLSSAL